MAYETTVVPAFQSQEDIRKLILNRGGTAIAFMGATEPERVEGFHCQIPIDTKTYTIQVTAKPRKMSSPEKQQQENRRIWRVLYFHLKAVFEAANSGVLEFREMMLPYIVTHDGRTVGQHILPQLDKAISGNPERMLPAPRRNGDAS